MELNRCRPYHASRCPERSTPVAARSTVVLVLSLIVAALIAAVGVRPDQDSPAPDVAPAAPHAWIAEAFPTGQAGFAHAIRDR